MKTSIDRAWDTFQAEIKKKALDAEVRGSQWLADGNAARESGNMPKAEKCYEKAQYWLDRYNRLSGRV